MAPSIFYHGAAMIYSEQTLAITALSSLGIVAEGQAPSADEITLAVNDIEGMLFDLTTRSICPCRSVEEVNPSQFRYLANVLAYRLRNEFSISGEKLRAIMNANEEAEMMLRTLFRRNEKPANMRVDRALLHRRNYY